MHGSFRGVGFCVVYSEPFFELSRTRGSVLNIEGSNIEGDPGLGILGFRVQGLGFRVLG